MAKCTLKYVPTDTDIMDVKNVCDPEETRLLNFVMVTGCTIKEALQITGTFILTNSVVFHPQHRRNFNLATRAIDTGGCLKDIHVRPEQRLFNRWRNAPEFLRNKVKILKQHPWNWINLRYRKAKFWYDTEKRPVHEVMILLGHLKLETTKKYLNEL